MDYNPRKAIEKLVKVSTWKVYEPSDAYKMGIRFATAALSDEYKVKELFEAMFKRMEEVFKEGSKYLNLKFILTKISHYSEIVPMWRLSDEDNTKWDENCDHDKMGEIYKSSFPIVVNDFDNIRNLMLSSNDMSNIDQFMMGIMHHFQFILAKVNLKVTFPSDRNEDDMRTLCVQIPVNFNCRKPMKKRKGT